MLDIDHLLKVLPPWGESQGTLVWRHPCGLSIILDHNGWWLISWHEGGTYEVTSQADIAALFRDYWGYVHG